MSHSGSSRAVLLGVLAVTLCGLGIGIASSRFLPSGTHERTAPPAPEPVAGWSVVASERPEEKPRPEPPVAPPRADANKRALLVGVTKYDHLPESAHLSGPANDVRLLRTTLVERYGFPAAQIVSLTEDESKPELRPTRANVAREFKRLAEAARAGEQVVVLLAGHGDRQPESDPPDPVAPEPDGIDEIFLPADVKPWKGHPERVPNAIPDKELRDWLAAITAKKAYVWIIFDCCHSASMIRDPKEPVRQLRENVLVPVAEIAKARERAAKRSPLPKEGLKGQALAPSAQNEYLVATFACREFETTPESLQPPDSAGAKIHGLLTYTVVSALEKSAASGSPLTYRELGQHVVQSYLARPQGAPTPTVDGSGQNRVVLGTEKPNRPELTLMRIKGEYVVNVGDLRGITHGSVLRVYSPAGEKEKPRALGYVRVEQTRALDSVVAPVEYDGTPKPAALPATGSCEVVAIDYSISPLRIGVEPGKNAKDDLKQRIADAIRVRSAPTAAPFQLADERSAQFLIRVGADGPELVAASGNRPPIPLPALDAEDFGAVLRGKLQTIHRARSLVAVGTRLESERTRSPSGPEVTIEVVDHRDKNDPGQVIERPSIGYVFRSGDRISFRVTNTSKTRRLEVTLLVVDPDYRIHLVRPVRNEVNKALEPGTSFEVSGTFGDKPPFGPEHMIAIITAPTNPPVDYGLLMQPGVLGRGNTGKSPIAQLLDRSMHGTGTRSGFTVSELDDQAARVLSWRTEPAPKK
jgi:hypothetical protein